MKILHVINSLDPAGGGPIAVVLGMCAALAKAGHEVSIVTLSSPDCQDLILSNIKNNPDLASVTVHFLPRPPRIQQLLGSTLSRALTPLFQSAQVVHLHGVWDSILLVSSRLCRSLGVPYVQTPHGMLDPWSMQIRLWKKKIALALGFRSMLNHAKVLHSTTLKEAEAYAQLGFTPPRKAIPLGMAELETPFPPIPGNFYQRFPKLEGKPFIVFLGRLHTIKGIDYLISAFSLIAPKDPDLQLVLVGPNEGALDSLLSQASAAGWSDRLHVLGPLWGPDKFVALNQAFCFCLPSRHENFGLVVAEAMWAGTPVLISDQVQICSDLIETQSGIVLPLDAPAWAKAILDLRANPAEHKRLSEVGRQTVYSKYRWPTIVKDLETMYHQAVATL